MVGDSGDWGGSSNANIIPLDTIKYYGRGKIPTKSLPQPCRNFAVIVLDLLAAYKIAISAHTINC